MSFRMCHFTYFVSRKRERVLKLSLVIDFANYLMHVPDGVITLDCLSYFVKSVGAGKSYKN